MDGVFDVVVKLKLATPLVMFVPPAATLSKATQLVVIKLVFPSTV